MTPVEPAGAADLKDLFEVIIAWPRSICEFKSQVGNCEKPVPFAACSSATSLAIAKSLSISGSGGGAVDEDGNHAELGPPSS